MHITTTRSMRKFNIINKEFSATISNACVRQKAQIKISKNLYSTIKTFDNFVEMFEISIDSFKKIKHF